MTDQRAVFPRVRRWLSRETSGGQAFLPEIDGLRFIAVMAVVFYHVAGYYHKKSPIPGALDLAEQSFLWQLLHKGAFGVQMFFVISGFIVAMPFLKHHLLGDKRPPLGKYFLRRLTRLEPPYIVSMIVAAVLVIVVNTKPVGDTIEHALVSIAYLHAAVYGRESTVNGVAWTLEIEVQFYLLMPLLACVGFVRHTLARRLLLVASIVGTSVLSWTIRRPGAEIGGLFLWHHAQYFLLGILLCDVHLLNWAGREPKRPWAGDLAAASAAIGLVAVLFEERHVELLAPLMLAVFFAGALRGGLLRAFLRMPFVYTVGGMCYTIYLYNFFAISALGRFTTRLVVGDNFTLNLLIQCLVLSVPTLAISAVLFALFERPFMERDWPRRAWGWVTGAKHASPPSPAPSGGGVSGGARLGE